MSGDIKISGLASGIAFDELVAKMVEAEKYQALKLESWKKTWQVKVDTLKELSSRVSSLQSANDVLRQSSSFISRLATSTNSSVADISVDSTSTLGSYKFEVAGAVKHKTGTIGLADDFELDADQTLSFNDGNGLNISVNLTAGMGISDINDAIQAELTNRGSQASVSITNDGSGFNSNRIVITSGRAGRNGNITFSDGVGIFGIKSQDSEFEGIDSSVMVPGGTYTGHISKRINFRVETGGKLDSGQVRLRWEDPTEGKSGVVTVNSNEVTLFQGLKINIADMDATLTRGQEFSLDVFAPDVQLGQDRGMAQSAQVTHSGLSSSTASVSNVAGTFRYSYRGVQSPVINVPANTSLEGLAKLINESPGNPGVRATIINDGMGTAQSFHLVLTGVDAGAANQIEVTQSTLSNMSDLSGFETTRVATNAMIKIDDYPQGDDVWIQKNTNLITDLISGASVRIRDVGVVNFAITNDDEDMADKVQSFVDEYNALLDYIDEITKVVLDDKGEANIDAAGVLVGNYAVNILRGNLRKFIGERGKGFDPDTDPYSLLTQIGLSSNDNKRIDFDREIFKSELNGNPQAVIDLFSANKVGSIDNNNLIYMSGTNDTKAGLYDFTVNYKSDGMGGYLDEIESVYYTDRSTGITYNSLENKDIRVSSDKKSFTVFSGGARGVAILNASGTGTENFSLRVKEGRARSFDDEIERLFHEETGLTKVLERNYENIIRNIDKRIDRENMRLLQVKKRLEMRFANLEVNMSNWNGQMERLQQQMRSLPTNV